MTNSDFYELDQDIPNLAMGYEDGPGGTRHNNILALGAIGSPAGGAYSTAEDLDRFHHALVNGTLLKPTTRATVWNEVTENSPGSGYGYGAQLSDYNGQRVVGHGGGWRGITNQYEFYPELGYTVVVLSNYDVEPGIVTDLLRGWLTQGLPAKNQESAGEPRLKLKVAVSAPTVQKGTTVAMTVKVENEGRTAHSSIVDLEVKDATGKKVFQRFQLAQKIEKGKSRFYLYQWTPEIPGRYTIGAGVFGPGWSPKLKFEESLASIVVE